MDDGVSGSLQTTARRLRDLMAKTVRPWMGNEGKDVQVSLLQTIRHSCDKLAVHWKIFVLSRAVP